MSQLVFQVAVLFAVSELGSIFSAFVFNHPFFYPPTVSASDELTSVCCRLQSGGGTFMAPVGLFLTRLLSTLSSEHSSEE